MDSSFRLVEYDEASPELKGIYDETMKLMGTPFVLNWFKCQGQDIALLNGNWEKLKGTMLTGKIPPLLKQLIYFKVSEQRGCKYCTFIHKMTADGLGEEFSQEKGLMITENLNSEYLPSSYRTAVKVISKCALNPLSTSEEDFDELYDEGFSTDEILELFAKADLINLLNTIADVSGIPIDHGFLQSV